MGICVLKNEEIINEEIIFKRDKKNNKRSVRRYIWKSK